MKMNFIKALSVGAVLALGLSANAFALAITPTSGTLDATRYEGNDTSQAVINGIIFPIMGAGTQELYKQNVGGSEEGLYAGSYETEFSNTVSDPSAAEIKYVGGPFIGPTAWLLVKDGKQEPAWYLFNLTALGWNGTDTLELSGFWPLGGAISHVSLYGTPGQDVPEPGTLALLGMGLVGFGIARRRRLS